MAEGALVFMPHPCPISEIYLCLIISRGYMLRKLWDKAEYYFRHAWSVAAPDGLIMPFAEIVGIGETTAHQIEESSKKKRKGFFGNQALTVSSKVQKILQDIKAFDKEYVFTYKELQKLKCYFIYDPCELFFEDN